ncbi:MAG: PH domain-containing protein [Pseudomonadales bacterium]|nr:PH domain-containing protein [Pseudomonadales bacterium]
MNDAAPGMFRNDPVQADELQDYRDVAFEPVACTFRRYTVLSAVATWVPILLVATVVLFVREVPMPVVAFVAGTLLSVATLVGVHRWLGAGYRGWALRSHDLIAREGILWRTVTALPVARIQHVETSSGPLERTHDLARLKLYTAGGSTADLIVIGLTTDLADRLREHLVEQIRLRDVGGDDKASLAELTGEHEPAG